MVGPTLLDDVPTVARRQQVLLWGDHGFHNRDVTDGALALQLTALRKNSDVTQDGENALRATV